MSDLKKYIAKRKKMDKEFAEGFEEGYEQLNLSVSCPLILGTKKVSEP
jgi:hypothetical protein